MKELFDVTVAGGIWELKKENYKNGYFYANVGDVNIVCGPGVVINRLSCGFFWNRTMPADTKLDDKDKFREAMASGGKAKKGCFGLTFGLGMALGNETLCNGDFNGFMAYDLKNDALSRLTLLGDMDALKGPEAKKGLLNARVKIDYVDNVAEVKEAQEQIDAGKKGVKAVERCQSFTLNATVDFKADTKKALEQFLGEGTLSELEKTLDEAAKAVKDSGLDEFSADKADEDNKGDGKTSGKDGAKSNLTASAGFNFSFEFQLRHYPDKKDTKWHVYLGEPARGKRCELVWIDFKYDSKLLKVWAKEYVNAYLCVGNELPKDENGVEGGLPALPDKLKKILDGDDPKSSKSVETNSNTSNLQAERAKQIQSGPSGAGIKGGIQFGAEAGADFGVEIPIGYLKAGALIGFDAVLKQYGDCACSDGSQLGGKNGFYAMAQLYAALWGSAGVSLDFGFWRGDFPLVDVAFGAVLKGGFPNPSWVYGKMRVKGEVLGGLISFNKAMEVRMGKVCVPEVASPLENIDIFSSYTVGDENKEAGWGKKGDGNGATLADPYTMPAFTTNMKMDSQLRLVDENELNTKAGLDGDIRAAEASSTKTFVFHLEPNATLQAYSNNGSPQGATKYCDITPGQNSRTSFTVNTGSMNQYQNYKMHVRGYCKQIIDGREQDPIIRNLETHKDEQKPWGQNLDLYFRTDKWSDDLSQEVQLFIPFDATGVILADAKNPYFCIANARTDMFDSPDKEWYVNMEENTGTTSSPKWRYPDLKYDGSGNRLTSEQSKWENIGVELVTEYDGSAKFHTIALTSAPGSTSTIKKNTQYRISLYSVDKKTMNEDLNKIKEARKSVASGQADVVQALTLLAYDENGNQTELGKDMMAWYNEQVAAGTKFSSDKDKVDQVINNFTNDKLGKKRYTTLEFQREFTTGNCNSFAEKLNSDESIYSSQTLKFKKSTVTRYGGTITARMKAGCDQLSSVKSTNPYRMLNWWASTACVSMMPAYRLTSKYGDESEYYMKDASLITYHFTSRWHGNPDPPAKRWGDYEFEKEVSPFYATKNWRIQSKSWGISGKTMCKNMVDSVSKVLYADGKMAAELPEKLRTSWNVFEKEAVGDKSDGVNQIRDKDVDWGWILSSARNGWKEPGDIEDLRDYNRTQFSKWKKGGYITAFRSNDTYWEFPLAQMCCILTCDVFDKAKYEPIWDHYYTYITYTGGSSRDTKGLMRTNTWSGTTRRGTTDAIYWIAGETAPDKKSYPFSMSSYLATIKELTFEVRRPTGYDANNGKYTLRPSTRFGNTVDMTQKVTLTDNDGSVKVTQSGSPTMVEDNDVHFDDENFKKYILAKFDSNRNGTLSKSEAENIRIINYNGREKGASDGYGATIFNLHGIEAMTNLEILIMDNVTFQSSADLSLSNNKKLKSVKFSYGWNPRNSNTGVKFWPDFSNLPLLDTLSITYMHTMNYDEIPYQEWTGIAGSIDVSKLTHLKYLSLCGNRITSVSGLDKLQRLEYLDLRGNQLTSIDATELPHTTIYVGQQYKYDKGKYRKYNSNETWMQLKVSPAYTKLGLLTSNGAKMGSTDGSTAKSAYNYHVEVTKSGNLKSLIAQLPDRKLITYIVQKYKSKSSFSSEYTLDSYAQNYPGYSDLQIAKWYLSYFTLKEDDIVKATSINISNKGIKSVKGLELVMPNLQTLQCNNNSLEELDPSLFPKLTSLYCSNNRIVELKCGEKLGYLSCSNNALSTLDLSKATSLYSIICSNNALTEIVLTNCPDLKYLTCNNNMLKSLDATRCTKLLELDISNNTDMVHAGTEGDALWKALYLPQSIEKLIAKGIYAYDGFSSMKLNLPNLKWLDMSDNPTITNYVDTKASEQLAHLDLHNTRITKLMSNTKKLTYLDVSNSNFDGNSTEVHRFHVDMTTDNWKQLKWLDVSDTKLNRLYIKTPSTTYMPTTFYVGAPNRTTGVKVELQMDENISAKWEKSWKYQAKNKYVYAHVGNGTSWDKTNSANVSMEGLSEDDKKMHRNLGETLYERLKKQYAPEKRWLHTYNISTQLKELDCSGLNITDIDSIVLWMPSLEKLNCSHNLITKANFSKLSNLKLLKIGRNTDLKSLTLPTSTVNKFDTIDVSYTKITASTFNSIKWRCKALIAAGVESITGTVRTDDMKDLTYIDLQHTNITKALLYSSNLETAKLDYCPKLENVQISSGTQNLTATCGGVNSDTEVKLSNYGSCKKWFENCADNPLNQRTSAFYSLISKEQTAVWVPVTSAKGAYNLDRFVWRNLSQSCITVNDKKVKLTVTPLQMNCWFTNKYYEGNDSVRLELPVSVSGTTRYYPVTTLEGAQNFSSMCSLLSYASQVSITNGHITLKCYTDQQLRKWFETYHQGNDDITTVQMRLLFKDNKAKYLTATKENYEALCKLYQFCRTIESSQLTLTLLPWKLTLNTVDEMRGWFQNCDEHFGSKTNVKANVTFSDKKTLTFAVTKSNYKCIIHLLQIFSAIPSAQYVNNRGIVDLTLNTADQVNNWFTNCYPYYRNSIRVYLTLRFSDNKTKTITVTNDNYQGVYVLSNICRTIPSTQYVVYTNATTLTLNTVSQVNDWFNNVYTYFPGYRVSLKLVFSDKKTTTIAVTKSNLEGVKDLYAICSSIPSTQFVTNSSGITTLTLDNASQLKRWFTNCNKYFGTKTRVYLKLTFKDLRTIPVPVTKANAEARPLLYEFCKRINAEQFGMKSTGSGIALFLKPNEREVWFGRAAPSTIGIGSAKVVDYSVNSDVRIIDYDQMATYTRGCSKSNGTWIMK